MNNKILLEAEYADIIITLLKPPYQICSIVKLVFIAFCIHHEFELKKYSNRKKDLISTFLSNINIKLISNPGDLSVIFGIIDKLKESDFIILNNDKIEVIKTLKINTENDFFKRCENKEFNPILEVNKLDTKAFMEEVLQYV